MIQRIQEVLRTQYIGAIVVAFLLFQAVGFVVTMISQPIAYYLTARKRSLFDTTQASFPWTNTYLPLVIGLVLYLLAAYLIIRWLYLEDTGGASDQSTPEEEAASDDDATA